MPFYSPQTTLLAFPGQGSQEIGMGAAFYTAHPALKTLFDEADDTLNFTLSKLMFEGDPAELAQTENAQPAILLAAHAAYTYLTLQSGKPADQWAAYTAGHSLGEYTALLAAGALDFPTALKLVRYRGQQMQKAVPAGQGAMAAVLGLSAEDVQSSATQAGCWLANDNSEGQAVISGSTAAVAEASRLCTEKGAKKVVPLNVSAPFHCPMMQPAADAMETALAQANIHTPDLPVILNVTAQAETNPAVLRANLVQQVVAPVRWRESMIFAADHNVTNILELGHGKVLSGLAKRCDARLSAISLGTPEAIDTFLEKNEP